MLKRILFIIFSFIGSYILNAQTDTFTVVTHNATVIKTDPGKGFTEYPAWGVFPDSTVAYRKVYLYLEFGCAPGLKCGEWDYINNIYIGKKGSNNAVPLRYELARFITPYGFSFANNWKHGWYFDLTDFSYLLHDSIEIIYRHSGYESNTDRGWTVTMQFNCIKGTPALQPIGIRKFFEVSAPYGDAANPFKNSVPLQNFTTPLGSDITKFKVIQTGHGMDKQENCSEFCSKIRTLKMDNSVISSEAVWRSNCGENSLYPQAGTWLYDRAGWCPGDKVLDYNIIMPTAEGTAHTFDLDMESYTNTQGGSANYSISAFAMYFKDNRKKLDAELYDVLTPSTHYEYLRINPQCGAPIVAIKNSGTDTITFIDFNYGKIGAKQQSIGVHCNIPPGEIRNVILEAVYDWTGTSDIFQVTITKVNLQTDENNENNYGRSIIKNVKTFPNKIIIFFKSNNAASENYYTLKDAKGNILSSKNNFANNTYYRDTVELGNTLCYTFSFYDDGPAPSNVPLNNDGLSWWANNSDGAGSIQLRNGYTGASLTNFNPDFGTSIIYNFFTTYPMGINAQQKATPEIEAYPNPSAGKLNVNVYGFNNLPAELSVYNSLGQIVLKQKLSDETIKNTVLQLPSGLFQIVVKQGEMLISKQVVVY